MYAATGQRLNVPFVSVTTYLTTHANSNRRQVAWLRPYMALSHRSYMTSSAIQAGVGSEGLRSLHQTSSAGTTRLFHES